MTAERSDAGVVVGTNVPYAETHQQGATIKPTTAKALHFEIGGHEVFAREVMVPRRAFLGLNREDDEEILAIVHDFVLEPFVGTRT